MLALASRSKRTIQGRSHTSSGVPTEPAISSHSRFSVSVTFRGSNICSTVVNMAIGNIHLLVSWPDIRRGAKHINLHFWWNSHDDYFERTRRRGQTCTNTSTLIDSFPTQRATITIINQSQMCHATSNNKHKKSSKNHHRRHRRHRYHIGIIYHRRFYRLSLVLSTVRTKFFVAREKNGGGLSFRYRTEI